MRYRNVIGVSLSEDAEFIVGASLSEEAEFIVGASLSEEAHIDTLPVHLLDSSNSLLNPGPHSKFVIGGCVVYTTYILPYNGNCKLLKSASP